MKDFRSEAHALRDEMVARRRDFHQHPELGFEEVRTAGIVAQNLSELGLEVQTGVGKTGVVGVLEGRAEGPTVLVRCDMDALPIHEENEVAYRSLTPGKMHACGHDAHTSIALGVARILNAHRDKIKGRIKFVFQPAEELSAGAKAMIQDGALENPKPDMSFGLHMFPYLPVGHVAITPGAMMAGGDKFAIDITGKGGHAARPNNTADPVITAAHIITALQSIVSRSVDPLDTAVLSVTKVRAGEVWNIIPGGAHLEGTLRVFSDPVRDVMIERMNSIVRNIAGGMNCQAEITIEHKANPLYNDPEVARALLAGFAETLPDVTRHDDIRMMESEDMPYFMDKAPGVYFFVGSGGQPENEYPLHHPRFNLNEDVLVMGASLLASAVSEYVLSE